MAAKSLRCRPLITSLGGVRKLPSVTGRGPFDSIAFACNRSISPIRWHPSVPAAAVIFSYQPPVRWAIGQLVSNWLPTATTGISGSIRFLGAGSQLVGDNYLAEKWSTALWPTWSHLANDDNLRCRNLQLQAPVRFWCVLRAVFEWVS